MKRTRNGLEVAGTVSFHKKNREFLGVDRIRLLEMIEEHGSITKAAKAVGISYKTAWDTMDAINNLSEKPLFIRMAGGRAGGGTRLTEEGREVIKRYRIIREEHEKFLANITERLGSAHDLVQFIKRISMKVSARNVFSGTVSVINPGAVNSEVRISLRGGETLVSVITNESVEALGLREGSDVFAIIKASSVLIGKELEESRLSTNNILAGRIGRIVAGAVNTEITLEIAGGNSISAVITNSSAQRLGIREGERVCAVFKASDVILGVN